MKLKPNKLIKDKREFLIIQKTDKFLFKSQPITMDFIQ